MVCGTSIYPARQLWVDVGHCFVLLCRMGEGGSPAIERRWEVVGWPSCACVSWLQLPSGGTFLWEWRGWAEEGTWWLFGRQEQRSTVLLPWGLSWISEALTAGGNSPRRRRQGNHKHIIDSLSFLQPIPSTNHIWKYSSQTSFAAVSKNNLTSFASPVFP